MATGDPCPLCKSMTHHFTKCIRFNPLDIEEEICMPIRSWINPQDNFNVIDLEFDIGYNQPVKRKTVWDKLKDLARGKL
jgi:hypothetical protein